MLHRPQLLLRPTPLSWDGDIGTSFSAAPRGPAPSDGHQEQLLAHKSYSFLRPF